MSALAVLSPYNVQGQARGEAGAEDGREHGEGVEVEEGGDQAPSAVNNCLILEADSVVWAELAEVEAPMD